MRPIIGLLAQVDSERSATVNNSYIKAITGAGGVPVLLPYAEDKETLNAFVDLCDGFVFTGGKDIDPSRYGEQKKAECGEIQYYRDELELNIFPRITKTSKPILAICRGAQLVNVALGGTLYQDIPSEIPTHIPHRQRESEEALFHEALVTEGTPLSAIAGAKRIKVNSIHHQAIKALGEGLEVMAVAEDGIIEAVYSTREKYLRAYQWHPERLIEACKESRAIFDDFISACKPKSG